MYFSTLLISVFLPLLYSETIIEPALHRKIEGIAPYEASATICFVVVTPINQLKSLLVLYDGADKHCSDNTTTGGMECPLIYHLQSIGENLRGLLTTEQSMSKESSEFPTRTTSSGSIHPVFPSLYTEETVRLETMEKINNYTENRVINEYSAYDPKLHRDSLNTYVAAYPNNPTTFPGNASFAITSHLLNTLGFLSIFAETKRWEEAVSQCKHQHVLPSLVVSTATLREELEKLLPEVEKKGYDFVIPISEKNISVYWTLPTVDCTFETNTVVEPHVVVLHLLLSVPLKRKGSLWSLHEFQSIPFHYNSSGGEGYICYRKEFEEPQLIYYDEGASGESHEAPEGSGEAHFLQHIPRSKKGFARNGRANCPSTLLNKTASDLDIVRMCRLECVREEEFESLVVKEVVGENTFYVARGTQGTGSLRVDCADGSSKDFVLPSVGALEVRLGCGCGFSFTSGGRMEASIPCNETLQVEAAPKVPIQLDVSYEHLMVFLK